MEKSPSQTEGASDEHKKRNNHQANDLLGRGG